MNKKISTSGTERGYYSKNWVENKIESTEDLIKIIRTKAYSNAIFKDGKRAGKNIIGFHDYLILDIDNDHTAFTIRDCESLFTSNNIAALIIPSKSHRKEKNGVIKDRYRVLCKFNKVIPVDISKETYRTMMNLIVKDLHMDSYIDTKALTDMSRYYYPSRKLDETLIRETSGKTINLDSYLNKATLHNNREGAAKQIGLMRKRAKVAERRKIALTSEKRINKNSKLKAPLPIAKNNVFFIYDKIYQYDVNEIVNNIDFMEVISHFEDIIYEEQTTNGIKLKTADKNTYQFFDDTNILYDLKNEVSFNLYSYVKNYFECNSREVLKHMKQYTNIDSYKSINESWLYAIVKSLDISTNRKEFEVNLRDIMKFDKVSIQKENEEIIIISGKKYHIADFKLQDYQCKSDIVKKFQENRKIVCSKNP